MSANLVLQLAPAENVPRIGAPTGQLKLAQCVALAWSRQATLSGTSPGPRLAAPWENNNKD